MTSHALTSHADDHFVHFVPPYLGAEDKWLLAELLRLSTTTHSATPKDRVRLAETLERSVFTRGWTEMWSRWRDLPASSRDAELAPFGLEIFLQRVLGGPRGWYRMRFPYHVDIEPPGQYPWVSRPVVLISRLTSFRVSTVQRRLRAVGVGVEFRLECTMGLERSARCRAAKALDRVLGGDGGAELVESVDLWSFHPAVTWGSLPIAGSRLSTWVGAAAFGRPIPFLTDKDLPHWLGHSSARIRSLAFLALGARERSRRRHRAACRV